jgi:dihydrofolate reductase
MLDISEGEVSLAGGADGARQYLRADLVDEMGINLVPIFLAGGARLFDKLGLGNPRFAHVRTVAAPSVMHLKFERA